MTRLGASREPVLEYLNPTSLEPPTGEFTTQPNTVSNTAEVCSARMVSELNAAATISTTDLQPPEASRDQSWQPPSLWASSFPGGASKYHLDLKARSCQLPAQESTEGSTCHCWYRNRCTELRRCLSRSLYVPETLQVRVYGRRGSG